uniref:ATS domain-containing protein n=1 Tax=Strongyloides papillosus TaxID=174720 RepID=A0A0N5BUD2_STREA
MSISKKQFGLTESITTTARADIVPHPKRRYSKVPRIIEVPSTSKGDGSYMEDVLNETSLNHSIFIPLGNERFKVFGTPDGVVDIAYTTPTEGGLPFLLYRRIRSHKNYTIESVRQYPKTLTIKEIDTSITVADDNSSSTKDIYFASVKNTISHPAKNTTIKNLGTKKKYQGHFIAPNIIEKYQHEIYM